MQSRERELTVLLVNFKDKFSPIVWTLTILTLDTKHLEESKPGFMKKAQEMRIDEFSRQELRENQTTIHKLTSPIQELQERVNLMNESGGRLSHVPSQPAVVPSPRGMLSRNQGLPPDAWNLLGTSGTKKHEKYQNEKSLPTKKKKSERKRKIFENQKSKKKN